MFAFSMGAPIGLAIALLGLAVLLFSRRKRLAAWLMGVGLLIAATTVVMILIAASTM